MHEGHGRDDSHRRYEFDPSAGLGRRAQTVDPESDPCEVEPCIRMVEGSGSVGGVDVVDVDSLGIERFAKLSDIRDLAGREFSVRLGDR